MIKGIENFIKSLFTRHEVIDHPKQTYEENEKRLNKKYRFLYPHWRFVTDLFFDMKQYDSVDAKELHQAWKATGVNGKRQKVFVYNGFTWTRVAIKTYSRSRKSSAWEVYFECKENGEQIYQSMSPYMRY